MTKAKRHDHSGEQNAEQAGDHPASQHSPVRDPGDETEHNHERKFAPDPFVITGDYAAGVKLCEHRRFRRAELEFADGKPSQAVIDKLKADHFRWHPQDKRWIRPIQSEDAMATRIEAHRTYQAVAALIREEKGLAPAPAEKSPF